MYDTNTVFAQIIDYVPRRRFQTIVNKYRGDFGEKGFKTNA